MPKFARASLVAVALMILMGLSVYSNSLNGKFIWDDDFLIKNNPHIKNWSCLPKIFTEDLHAGSGERTDFYRPIQALTNMADYSLWKLNVRGYHLTNIMLHILVALSLFWFTRLLFNDNVLSLLAGALFLVHPIHTAAVAYISGRADSLAAFFTLTCLIYYVKLFHVKTTRSYLIMLFSYVLAILSKETSLILPLLLLLCHYFFNRKVKPVDFLIIIVVPSIYLLIRLTLLSPFLSSVHHVTNLSSRLPGFFAALFSYIKLLLIPLGLHMEYGARLFAFTDARAIAGFLLFCGLVSVIFIKRKNKLIFFCVSWFFLALLPVSNIYPINGYMAEHWLYLPSIGFFIILAKRLSRIYKIEKIKVLAVMFIVALLGFYSYLTMRQNNYWKDPVLFYTRTLKYAPESTSSYNNLGKIYHDERNFVKAKELYKKAIAADPNCIEAYNNLGNIYKEAGEAKKAIAVYKRAIQIDPGFVVLYNNLGNVYAGAGKYSEAVMLFKTAIDINPNFAEAYNELGNVYKDIRETKKAIAAYKKAIEINPWFAIAYSNLGNAYLDIGSTKEAFEAYKEALILDPDFAVPYSNLGYLCILSGNYNDAIVFFSKAIEIDPACASAHNNLALAYYHEKKYVLAAKHCDVAIKLGYKVNPDFLESLKPHRK